MITSEDIIKHYNLKPLSIEGGYYSETYRAYETIEASSLPRKYNHKKALSTAIIYLLTPDTFSTLHRLKSDEIFHFYMGDPVTMLNLYPDGSSKIITLGKDILKGQKLQVIIHQGVWQGAILKEKGKWALMGTTVSPAFDYDDYEEGSRKELVDKYPEHKDLIKKITKS